MIAMGGGLCLAFLLSATGATASAFQENLAPIPPQIKPTVKQEAARLVALYDQNSFGGFFSSGGRSHVDVLAVFQIESNFEPGAIRRNDGNAYPDDHAMGIGQVLISTARDYQITNPNDLLSLETGVFVAMQHLKWSFDFLAGRMKRPPTYSEWIGSYNAGVGNALKGFFNAAYVAKHRAAKALIKGSSNYA